MLTSIIYALVLMLNSRKFIFRCDKNTQIKLKITCNDIKIKVLGEERHFFQKYFLANTKERISLFLDYFKLFEWNSW